MLISILLAGLATTESGLAQSDWEVGGLGIPQQLTGGDESASAFPSSPLPAPERSIPRFDPWVFPAAGWVGSRLDDYEEIAVPADVLPIVHYPRISSLGIGETRPFSVAYTFMGRAGVDDPATNVKMNEIALAYLRRVPVGERLLVSLRPFFDVMFLDGPGGGTDIPDQLYEVVMEIQGDYRIDDTFAVVLQFSPGFWTDFVKVDQHDVRLPFQVVGTARRGDFLFAAGVHFTDNIRGNWLPTGGVVWRINDRTDLELLYPRSRLVYYLHEEWHVYVVAERYSTTYHIRSIADDEDFEYRDLHVLLGTQLDVWEPASLFIELGSTMNRRFRFDRQATRDINPAFFLRIGSRF